MSPLARLLLKIMRAGSLSAAGFMVLVIGIEVWKRWRFGGYDTMARQDVVLVLLLAGFLWLARSIGRELKQP